MRSEASRTPGPFSSLRARIVAWNILLLAAMLAVLGAAIPFLVRSAMLASVDRDLMSRARRFIANPPPGAGMRGPRGPAGPREAEGPPDGPEDRPPRHMPPPDEPSFIGGQGTPLRPRIVLTNPPAGRTPAEPWDPNAIAEATRASSLFTTVRLEGEPVRVLSVRFPPEGEGMGVVQFPYAIGEINRAVSGLVATLFLLAPVALLLAGAGGFALTGRALRPVKEIAQAADRISADALHERLPEEGDDEFAHLTATFNAMLARLEEAFGAQQELVARLTALVEQQRRFTADASHELRTPLTAIKANASLSLSGQPDASELRQAMREVDLAATAMARLVDDLLLLARSGAGQLARNTIELPLREPLVQAIARARATGGAPISFLMDDETLTVVGCEDELVRLFANLLENASRHTPAVGSIAVTARGSGACATIEVTDTGGGIAPEHLAHLGERFYRVDAARARIYGGTGLGLSICKSIAEAHGGSISFESVVGKGTTVRVTLPLAPGATDEGSAKHEETSETVCP